MSQAAKDPSQVKSPSLVPAKVPAKKAKKKAKKKAPVSKPAYKIPLQFKPERPISEGPWSTIVERSLSSLPYLKREELEATEDDLKLISKLAYRRDDLGDNLAALIFKDRKVAHQLEQGLSQGIASLDNPPKALVDFLDYYENVPDWAYMKNLKAYMETPEGQASLKAERRAPKPNAFIEALAEGVGLAGGFFVGAYYPAVGQALVATGSVAGGSSRIIQTFNFVADTSDIRDFMPFGKAIQAGAKVRLAHAFARRQIEKSGLWDKEYYGEVISDFDNMIFASGLLAGDFNSQRSVHLKDAGIYQVKAIAYLLGAPRELLELSQEESMRFFVMVVGHLDGSPETAAKVLESFQNNEHYKPEITFKDKFYKGLTYFSANMATRIAWGNEMAEDIKFQQSYFGIPLAPIATFIGDRVGQEPPKALVLSFKGFMKLRKARKNLSKKLGSNRKRNSIAAPDRDAYKGSFGAFDSE